MVALSWIYVVYIEPLLALGYLWVMWRIKRSPMEKLQTPFYLFFILSGVASCVNIYLIVLKGLVDKYIPESRFRDFAFNFIIFGSHSFSLSHTIGKFWTPRRTKIAAVLMFIIPALLHSFMIPLDAIYRLNSNGVMFYVGVEVWAQQLSKIISFTSYTIFIGLSVPMCAASMYHLRLAKRFNKNLVNHERRLLIYTVAITIAHLVKSAQQIFWFITMILDNARLFDLATMMYNAGNTLTTFAPPILLIAMSRLVRTEVLLGCISRDLRYDSTVTPNYRTEETIMS